MCSGLLRGKTSLMSYSNSQWFFTDFCIFFFSLAVTLTMARGQLSRFCTSTSCDWLCPAWSRYTPSCCLEWHPAICALGVLVGDFPPLPSILWPSQCSHQVFFQQGHTSGGVLEPSQWLVPHWIIFRFLCWRSCQAASPCMSSIASTFQLCASPVCVSRQGPNTHYHTSALVGQLFCRSCPSVVVASYCHTALLSTHATWASHMPSLPWDLHQCCYLCRPLSQGTWSALLWWWVFHLGRWYCCQPCTLSLQCWAIGRGGVGGLSTSTVSPGDQVGSWSTAQHHLHRALSMVLALGDPHR